MKRRLIKRALPLFLVILTLCSLSMTAFAAEPKIYPNDPYPSDSYDSYAVPDSYYYDPAAVPTANNGQLTLVQTGSYYDHSLRACVYTYALSDASKISLLLDKCQTVYSLRNEITLFRASNTIAALGQYVHSDQIAPIWQHLTMTTRDYINRNCTTAEQALAYIRKTVEYRDTADLATYVEYYASHVLTGARLREILIELDPKNAEPYKTCSTSTLLRNADKIVEFRAVRAIEDAMSPFVGLTTDAASLERQFNARQLSEYRKTLAWAASSYYPDFVEYLNNAVFTALG